MPRQSRRLASYPSPGLALAGAGAPESPGREPVLKQIRVPHRYYYREMYLPQVTSGPDSPAWSPDGRRARLLHAGLALDMEPGSGLARQVTDGPGYHFQPDWSTRRPLRRLRRLRPRRGRAARSSTCRAARPGPSPRAAPSTSSRASPPTARAWPSCPRPTRDASTCSCFPCATGRPAGPAPATSARTRTAGLPRYYYSRFDHYLSPSWSPDGQELLYVSNHGRIWGAGGFWRMRAEPGAPRTEVRHEETSWKARPDWSRDGKRVVYSSYQGRQWNQLWLVPAPGGEAFAMTYGEFDATLAALEPGRPAHRLRLQRGRQHGPVHGRRAGRPRQKLEMRERRLPAPHGLPSPSWCGARTAERSPARLSVTAEDGRGYAPDDALRHADDNFDRAERPFEYTYFHTAAGGAP